MHRILAASFLIFSHLSCMAPVPEEASLASDGYGTCSEESAKAAFKAINTQRVDLTSTTGNPRNLNLTRFAGEFTLVKRSDYKAQLDYSLYGTAAVALTACNINLSCVYFQDSNGVYKLWCYPS